MKQSIVIYIRRIIKHDISGIAAKSTYYLLLSFFPLALLLLSAVSKTDTAMFEYVMPPFVLKILQDVITITPNIKATVLSSILAVWSASKAIWALMDGIHLAYTHRTHDKIKYGRIRAFIFTLLLVVFAFVCVSFTLVSNAAVDWVSRSFAGLNPYILRLSHMFFVFIFIFLFILSLYAVTPGIKMRIRTIYIGILLTSIGWIITTRAFEIYMKMFSNYSMLYGSIGAFLGLAIWLYLVTMVLFCGAEINAVISENK